MSDLTRFRDAQANGVHDRAVAELRAGAKTSHWMWFVFPQLASLGRSSTARHYGIADLAHARAYLADPVLGPRLREAAAAMLENRGRRPEAVLGGIDALKLRSSATLFLAAAEGEADAPFRDILDAFYGGAPDPLTERALAG